MGSEGSKPYREDPELGDFSREYHARTVSASRPAGDEAVYVQEGPIYRDDGPACDGMCFEPAYQETQTKWKYVGEGKGTYEQMQDFNYVGSNQGEFKKQERPWLKAIEKFCEGQWMYILGGTVLLLLLWALVAEVRNLFAGPAPTGKCSGEVGSWTQDHRRQCCQDEQIGCPSQPEPFDCMSGYFAWQKTWSPGQQLWCCDHYKRGCKVTTTPVPFDCEDGYPYDVPQWDKSKKAWCCEHERVACPGDVSINAANEFHNCQEDYQTWVTSWTARKKAWCCQHENVACGPADTTTPPPAPTAGPSNYDCNNGLGPMWSSDQVQWCCTHEQVCYTKDGTQAGPECQSVCDYGGESASCSNRVQWLVAHTLSGTADACPTAVRQVRDECPACQDCGFVDICDMSHISGQASQSAMQAVVAAPSPAAAKFDCSQGFGSWETLWSVEKKAWCCIHAAKACPPKETLAKLPFSQHSYDCFRSAKETWSANQRAWCCINQFTGCDQ